MHLGQSALEPKSNKIMAVSKVLGPPDLTGAVVTVDALNTHRAIAAQVVDAGGDYGVTLNNNHPMLGDRVV